MWTVKGRLTYDANVRDADWVFLGIFGKTHFGVEFMRSQCFDDFDAFAESVQGVESKMMLHNPKRRMWTISSLDLDGMTVQVGQR